MVPNALTTYTSQMKQYLLLALLSTPVLAETTFNSSFEKDYSDCSTVTLTGNQLTWSSFFKNIWPGPKTEKQRVQIPVGGYLAIKFSTRSVKDVGKLSSIEAAGTHGYRLGSVSRCAGDFIVEDVCKWAWGTWGGITWDTSGETDTGNCNLDPGEDYYWNMTFTDGVNPNSSRCIGTYCETWVIAGNNDYVAP